MIVAVFGEQAALSAQGVTAVVTCNQTEQ
jgi:hypothetical protein